MPYNLSPTMATLALSALRIRMAKMADEIPGYLFRFDRNGVRAAISSIEDETGELYDEWVKHKRALGNAHEAIESELLDIAGVAMIAYIRAIAENNEQEQRPELAG